jgi:NAD(P)-dependent dehydrogenase (short-subunit alcohol dehydrogenase family)
MERVLITGSNRGIGLALARQYLRDGHLVVPTYRQKSTAESLFAIAASEPQKWFPVRYDAAEPETAADLVEFVDKKLGKLDLLVNNAGMNSTTSGYSRETNTLGQLSSDTLLDYLATNAIAPILLSQVLLPALRKSSKPIIVNVLSSSGSISGKDFGGNYGYALSKAALSMATKVLAADLGSEGFIVVGIHPGWVRTRLGGKGGFLTPEESASFLVERISALSPTDNGALLNWDGSEFAV